MLSGVPVAASDRIFKDSIIEGLFEDHKDIRYREMFTSGSLELRLVPQPVMNSSPRPLLVRYLLEYLPNNRSTHRINDHLAWFVFPLFIEISGRSHRWAQSLFAPRPQPSLHVFGFVVILEFRSRAHDHQHEFLARVVREFLAEG